MHSLNLQNVDTFTYQKTLLHTLLLIVLEIFGSLECILNNDLFVCIILEFIEVRIYYYLIGESFVCQKCLTSTEDYYPQTIRLTETNTNENQDRLKVLANENLSQGV